MTSKPMDPEHQDKAFRLPIPKCTHEAPPVMLQWPCIHANIFYDMEHQVKDTEVYPSILHCYPVLLNAILEARYNMV